MSDDDRVGRLVVELFDLFNQVLDYQAFIKMGYEQIGYPGATPDGCMKRLCLLLETYEELTEEKFEDMRSLLEDLQRAVAAVRDSV